MDRKPITRKDLLGLQEFAVIIVLICVSSDLNKNTSFHWAPTLVSCAMPQRL